MRDASCQRIAFPLVPTSLVRLLSHLTLSSRYFRIAKNREVLSVLRDQASRSRITRIDFSSLTVSRQATNRKCVNTRAVDGNRTRTFSLARRRATVTLQPRALPTKPSARKRSYDEPMVQSKARYDTPIWCPLSGSPSQMGRWGIERPDRHAPPGRIELPSLVPKTNALSVRLRRLVSAMAHH